MRRRPVALLGSWLGAVWLLLAVGVAPVAACSHDFEPSIAKLGPGQVVLIGTTGESVAGGRAFHVERWFNGTGPATITIAFKEGEAVGDCSYPVFPGWHMIVAPYQEVPGRLSVDFGTLQADVDSDLGRQYIAEAERLFGPGSAPIVDAAAPPPDADIPWLPILLGLAGLLVVVLLVSRDRRNRLSAEAHLEQLALRAEQDRSLSRGHGYVETDGPPGVGM